MFGLLGKALGKVVTPIVSGLGGPGRSGGEFGSVDPNMGRSAELENMQRGQFSRLQAAASGQGPSMAAMQGRAATDQGLRQLQSQAASDRQNPALARRQAMIQGGQLSARIGQSTMMGRLQEQQQAEQALAAAVANARAAELQRAGMVEGARTARYTTMMNTPTAFERGANLLSSALPVAGQIWGGGEESPGGAGWGTNSSGRPNPAPSTYKGRF